MPKQIHISNSNVLQQFLDNNRGTDGFTHTSIGAPMGKYSVKPSDLETFFDLYHDVVFNEDNPIPTYLTEGIKDCDITPIKIDIDLRYYNNRAKRIYTNGDVDEMCMRYMASIEEYLEELEDTERLFYILEKPGAIFDLDKKGNKKARGDVFRIKDGFHIMAPNIVTNDYLQLKFRDKVYKHCGDFLDRHDFDNSYADIFDRAVIDRNNWQMYGSTKPGKPAYRVSRIIRVFKDHVEAVEEIPPSTELIRLLSVRNKTEYSMLRTSVEEEVWAPENNQPKKKRKRSKHNAFKSKVNKYTLGTICGGTKDKDGFLIKGYVDCLDVSRAESFHTWLELGWCLHNIHNRDDKLLNKWITFSKRIPQYADTAEIECREKWEEMADEGYGIGSLKLWAREDSKKEHERRLAKAISDGTKNPVIIKALVKELTSYEKIVQSEIATHIYGACRNGKGSSYDIAKILKVMFENFHICVSIKDHTWFYYNGKLNKWQRDDKGIMLKRKISTKLYDQFQHALDYEHAKGDACEDQEKRDASKKRWENIAKVMFRLKETSFKNNLMTEAAELFYDREKIFLDSLDEANHLIGFNNGVYDLKREEFRVGRPEDYISKSTNINYIPIAPGSDEIYEILEFYKQIFVIKSVRDYVLIRSSSFLSGSTKDESFDIYSGGGGNGKSKHMELIEKVFGDYAVKLPIQLLTAKRAASNAATPELARTKGARLCSMQEPDSETSINVGLMKELTGGDKIQARALYGEPFEFKPKFKMVLCCNDKPKLPERDEGTWRRVRNTEFSSKFTYDIDGANGLDFKINEELAESFEGWAEPFMALLLEYHKRYKKEGLKVPCEISEYTNSYRNQSNVFKDFINDRLDFDPSISTGLTISEVYSAYKLWHNGMVGDNRPKSRKDLQQYLDDKYGKYVGIGNKTKGYKGFLFKNDKCAIDSDDDDGDELDH